jgi:hypothetical protein
MKRRDFLKAAVTPAVVAATEWCAAAEALRAGPFEITAVLYDDRYADCRAFAKALERHGATSFATVGGDAASVWYGGLRASLMRSGGRVAGMTTDSDWMVSRACGRERGLGMAYEGSHDCRKSDRLIHRLYGNGTEWEVYMSLLHAGIPWAESVANGLVRSSGPGGARREGAVAIAKADAVLTRVSTGHPGYLTSWLLDPSAF